MHRPVLSVFKILGISIVAMLIYTTSLIVVDRIIVEVRVSNLSVVMQEELSKHNCIPDSMVTLFEEQLQDIIDRSMVAIAYRTNMRGPLTFDGNTYDSISESNVKDYGSLLHLAIQIDFEPERVIVNKQANSDGSFLERVTFKYTSSAAYPVPALRYLK